MTGKNLMSRMMIRSNSGHDDRETKEFAEEMAVLPTHGRSVEELPRRCNISPVVAQLLLQRQITQSDAVQSFLRVETYGPSAT